MVKRGSKTGRTYSRSSQTPRSITDLMSRSSVVGRMSQSISTQQSWVEWLRALVPIELSKHIVHVVPKESELVVFADTAAWCARLRYAVGTLASQISARDAAITRTTLRVQPSSREP